MVAPTVTRRLSAIVVADVAGYSRLMERDESGTHARLKELREQVIDPKIAEYDGRIVKTAGDGLLLEFTTAGAALRCVLDIQRTMAVRNHDLVSTARVDFRIGINVGDIIIDGNDVAGDGVNVAARLEALAEPGGICVTAAVRDQMRDEPGIRFLDIGEQRVKNIERPIRVYRVAHDGKAMPRFASARTKSWAPLAMAVFAGAGAIAALALGVSLYVTRAAPGSSPPLMSIAVIPFVAAGAAADVEFAEALTRDISTGLARGGEALAVASHSAAASYRGKAVDARAVGRDLNVRYMVEGEVRREGEKSIVSVQMIDTGSTAQVWSERFELDAIGAGVDEAAFARRVTSRVRGALFGAEVRRLGTTSAQGATARELVWRSNGIESAATLKATREAGKLLEDALKLEPNLVPALTNRALNLISESDLDPRANTVTLQRRADELSERAVALDPDDAFAWIARAGVLGYEGRIEAALGAGKRARELDPTRKGAMVTDAWLRLLAGRPHEALSLLDEADKAFPGQSELEVRFACWANLNLGHYDEAIALCEKAAGMDAWYFDYVLLAAAYANKGDLAKAAAAKVELEQRIPGYSIGFLEAQGYSQHPDYARQAATHLYPGLRNAGVPQR